MQNLPLVSVCVTTFNRFELLLDTLAAIEAQTYKNIEVILVDDHSSDITHEAISEKKIKLASNVRYIYLEKNGGLSNARNIAIAKSKGKYFTFCDDDDLWEESYVSVMVKEAEKNGPGNCYCCGNVFGSLSSLPPNKTLLKKVILDGFTPPTAGQFYWLKDVKKVGGYTRGIKSGVDHDLWLKLSKLDLNICVVRQKLCRPNQDTKLVRMTTDATKRIAGISKALEVWKPLIESTFSKGFFQHFEKNYYFYIHKNLIFQNFHAGNYLICLKFLTQINKKMLFALILRRLKGIFGMAELSTPAFFPWTD